MLSELQGGTYGPVLAGGRMPALRAVRRVIWYLTTLGLVATVGVSGFVGVQLVVFHETFTQVQIPGLEQPVGVTPALNQQGGDGDDDGDPQIAEARGTTNILLVGRDSREGLTDEQLLRLGTEMDSGLLTDTVILVQLNADTKQVGMLSFPRDLLVTRCDNTRGRINGAYEIGTEPGMEAIGGPGCLVQTVNQLTDIPIDHYVEMDLAGFIDAVDAVGGVTFYLDQALTDRAAGLDVGAGCQTFDGVRALSFVRARKALDSDFGRIARQQRFLRELAREATSLETVANPVRLTSLVSAVARALTVDDGLSVSRMVQLAFTFRDLSSESIVTATVPATDSREFGEAAVLALDEAAAAPIFSAFRTGDLATIAAPAPVTGPLAVEDVPAIRILNGTGEDGLASRASTALLERGFTVLETGEADRYTYVRTTITYPPEQAAEAALVADAVPGSRLEEGEPGTRITLIAGSDFDDIAFPPPTPTDAPTTSAEPSPSAEPLPSGLPSPFAPVEPSPQPTFAGAALSSVECS